MSPSGDRTNPFAAPRAALDSTRSPGPSSETKLEHASLLDRLFATALDALIYALGFLLLVACILILRWIEPTVDPRGSIWIGAVLLFWWAAVFLFQLSQYRSGGWTLGKRALRIKVLRSDGSRAGLARIFFLRMAPVVVVLFIAFLVSIDSFVPGLPYLVLVVDAAPIFGPSRRCLHDFLAGTIVVKAPRR